MNNKLLQNFISGFLSCFKFVPPFQNRTREFTRSWYDTWFKVAGYVDNGLKKLEKKHERD